MTWPIVPLGELGTGPSACAGGPFGSELTTRDYVESPGVPVIRGANLGEAGFIDDGFVYVSLEKAATLSLNQALPGDVVFTQRGTIGQVAMIPLRPRFERYIISQSQMKLTPDLERIEPRYLVHYFRSPSALRLLKQNTLATGVPHINLTILRRIPVPMPSLAEQQRIADLLDKAETIRRKRQEAIALTDDLLRSTFLEMFGDPVTNPKGWPVVALTNFAAITTGNTPPRNVPAFYGEHIEWIKSDNINTSSHFLTPASERLSEAGRAVGRVAPSGSSLVTCIAGSKDCIGNIALADREVAFNQQINAVTPRAGADFRFVYALLLNGKPLIQSASTGGMKGMVSKGRLENLRFPRPPLDLQVKFGAAFDAIARASKRTKLAQEASEQAFFSLVNSAFLAATA